MFYLSCQHYWWKHSRLVSPAWNVDLVISSSGTVEGSWSRERFQVFPECQSSRIQQISSGTVRRGQRDASDQRSPRLSRNVSNPAGPSKDELSRHTRRTKTVLQFHFWYTVSMPQRQNPMNAIIFISRPNPFVSGYTHQNWSLPKWCRLSLINCILNGLGWLNPKALQ